MGQAAHVSMFLNNSEPRDRDMVTANPTMNTQDFIKKWRDTRFGERQAAQAWFLDLLRVVENTP